MTGWRANFWIYAAWVAGLTLLFVAVYGGTNWWSAQHSLSHRAYMDWELRLPFVPALILVYCSIGLVFWLPLFGIERHQIRPLGFAFALATVVAGLCFIVFPARLGFERPALVPGYASIFAMLYALDLPYNTIPSLHVTYSTLAIAAAARAARHRPLQVALGIWLLVMVISVVLIRQHHVVDVAAGLILGWSCYRLYVRWSTKRPSSALDGIGAWSGSEPLR